MRALAATLLLATALVGCAANVDPVVTGALSRAGAAVKIEMTKVIAGVETPGVGSGVYIGGVIITAAHVLKDAANVKIKSDAGDIQGGTVLWSNEDYDIAAILPANSKRFDAAQLACVTPKVGDVVHAWGNPAGIESITMHGFVSGAAREAAPNWKSVFLTDMTTIGGMSGGPTYNEAGQVVGITVGTMSFNGPAGGLGFVVPGSVVCMLLGREAV